MKYSVLGNKLSSRSGILELMDDLGRAMAGGDGQMRMMGGGNPGQIPEVQDLLRKRMRDLLDQEDGSGFDRMIGNYDPPKGNAAFIESLAEVLSKECGWEVGPENIAITAGGQSAFFLLFNLFAGVHADGVHRKILLPLVPEYIGYENQGALEDVFCARRPIFEHIDKHTFKYHVDFENLDLDDSIAAICVSRPTNPSGNVLTDKEIHELARRAKAADIPLIVDSAYGLPFPGVIFAEDATPIWNPDIILTLSLSKLGLPGTRTGIVVARPEIAEKITAMTSVIGLANTNIGQQLVEPMLRSGEVVDLSQNKIRPFYARKSAQAIGWVHEFFDDALPYHVHISEGALFLWLWFEDLPITTRELYERLKDRKVLIVPGGYFIFGLEEPWNHGDECIRLTFSQSESTVREGIAILAEEVARAYAEG